jgi:hypothetical protein
MISAQRCSILWFMLWAIGIIIASTLATANSKDKPMIAREELIHEIESLEVINQVNSGTMDVEKVAVREGADVVKTPQPRDHRTTPRSILSQH